MLLCATKRGYEIIKHMNKNHRDLIGCVSTFKDINMREKWNEKIVRYCKKNDIFFINCENLRADLKNILLRKKITNIIAIGWRYLLPLDIIKYLKSEIIVFHDSLLPKYRGFSPTPTAIICGERKIGLSVIFANNDIDNGDIIIQKSMSIDDNEYINEVIDKSVNLYKEAIEETIIMIRKNTFSRFIQDKKESTYSLWRDEVDCRIDWNKSNREIYNLIRAVSHPYMGAYTYLDGKKIIINRALKADYDLNFVIRDPGKIWSICNNKPLVVCGKGLLSITNAEYKNKNKVVFDKTRSRLI